MPFTAWRALDSEAVRARLRVRAVEALATHLPAARLEGDVHVDGLFRVVLGPVVVPARHPGAPSRLRIERVTVRPRVLALLGGRVEPAAIAFDEVRVEAGRRGEELAQLARDLRPARGAAAGPVDRPSAPPVLAFSGLVLRFGGAGRAPALVVGPLGGRVHLRRDGAGREAALDLRAPGGARGHARVRWGDAPPSVEAHLRHLGADAIPAAVLARLPFEITAGSAELDLVAPRAGAVGTARLDLNVRDAAVQADRLAPEPVGPLAMHLGGTLRWSLPALHVALEDARAAIGEAPGAAADVRAALDLRPEPRFALEVRASALDWAGTVAALPAALAPPPEAPRLRGTIAGRVAVAGPVHRRSAWRVEGELDPSGLRPAGLAPGAPDLSRPFVWKAPLRTGGTRDVIVGPQSPDFVPLGALPPYLVRAVLASEDAGFYGHHGFDLAEVQDALAHAHERRRLRGASTITQQLAKNLYLSRERTLARKLREALATLALETTLGKRRLLEIYLNVAEWGSGVNGIGQAARHWFGKDARALDPKEAAFLATVIPNPVRYEMYLRRGALTDAWEDRVRDLLMKLRAVDALTDDEFVRAWDERVTFAARG